MGYCAYETLVGKQVIIYHPDHQNTTFAVIGTLDGVGDTAIGIKDWQALNLNNLARGPVNKDTLVINKHNGFRRIILASAGISEIMIFMRARASRLTSETESINKTLSELSGS